MAYHGGTQVHGSFKVGHFRTRILAQRIWRRGCRCRTLSLCGNRGLLEWLLLQGLSRRDPSAVVDLPDRARGPGRVLPAGRAEVALDPQGRASREPLLVQGPCMASRRDPSALQDLPDRARGPRRVLPAGRAELVLDLQGRASREPLLVSGPSRRDLQDLPDWARGPRRVLPAGRAEVALEPLLV